MTAKTLGIDHLGLTVRDLEKTATFFCDCLGWKEVGGKPDYPSKFISDGSSVLTLWQVHNEAAQPFDRRANIGLHHLALKIASEAELDALFNQVKDWPGIEVECAPEFSGAGPKVHFFVAEPGGLRLEFAYDPR
ncbi:MAG: VOC family protein [Rhizobiaceae bacterium]|nr:VOC family protein [Rhizobiaceae bacterium]